MFGAHRTSVYEAYDEDTFLAEPDGGPALALTEPTLSAERPRRRRRRMHLIIVASSVAGATLAVASLAERRAAPERDRRTITLRRGAIS